MFHLPDCKHDYFCFYWIDARDLGSLKNRHGPRLELTNASELFREELFSGMAGGRKLSGKTGGSSRSLGSWKHRDIGAAL